MPPMVKFFPNPLLPLRYNPNILSKQIKSIFLDFIPTISPPNINLSFLLSLGGLQSKYPNAFDFGLLFLVLIPLDFYHASHGKTSPKTPPSTLVQPKLSVQANKIHFLDFIPIISLPKIILSFLLSLGDLQSKYLNTFEF